MTERLKLWAGLIGLVLLSAIFLQTLSKARAVANFRRLHPPVSTPPASLASNAGAALAAHGPQPFASAQAASAPAAAESDSQKQTAPLVLDDEAKATVRACLRESPRSNAASESGTPETLDDLATSLSHEGDPRVSLARRKIDIVTSPDGERKRLLVLVKDAANGGTVPKAQIFKTSEGERPVAQALPPAYRDLSMDEIVERFKSEGHVQVDEATSTFSWSTDETAIVTTKDGRVRDLQFMFDQRSLGCAHDRFSNKVACSCY